MEPSLEDRIAKAVKKEIGWAVICIIAALMGFLAGYLAALP